MGRLLKFFSLHRLPKLLLKLPKFCRGYEIAAEVTKSLRKLPNFLPCCCCCWCVFWLRNPALCCRSDLACVYTSGSDTKRAIEAHGQVEGLETRTVSPAVDWLPCHHMMICCAAAVKLSGVKNGLQARLMRPSMRPSRYTPNLSISAKPLSPGFHTVLLQAAVKNSEPPSSVEPPSKISQLSFSTQFPPRWQPLRFIHQSTQRQINA